MRESGAFMFIDNRLGAVGASPRQSRALSLSAGSSPGGSAPTCAVINKNLFIADRNRPFRCLFAALLHAPTATE